MNTRSRFRSVSIGAGFLLCAGLLLTAFGSSKPSAPQTPRVRTFEFSYKAVIAEVPEGTKDLRVWLPYPTTDDHQEISDMEVVSPVAAHVYREPKFGDSDLFIDIPHPAKTPIEIEMKFNVRRSEYLKKDYARYRTVSAGPMDPSLETFLGPDRLVPIDGRIKRLSNEVTHGKTADLDKVKAIYDYVLANMKYDKSGTGWGHGDIIYACDAKHGNCTDFHALFIGLCRAAGIPARFSIGFSIPEQHGEGEIPGYHCWAEFHLPGYGWVPIDASEAWKHPEKRAYFFGAHDENRVQFSTGRDIILSPAQQGESLNYFLYPYAEADGKSIQPSIKTHFAFKDLPGDTTARGF